MEIFKYRNNHGAGFMMHDTPGIKLFSMNDTPEDKAKFAAFHAKVQADPTFKDRFFKQKNLSWNMKGAMGKFLKDKGVTKMGYAKK